MLIKRLLQVNKFLYFCFSYLQINALNVDASVDKNIQFNVSSGGYKIGKLTTNTSYVIYSTKFTHSGAGYISINFNNNNSLYILNGTTCLAVQLMISMILSFFRLFHIIFNYLLYVLCLLCLLFHLQVSMK